MADGKVTIKAVLDASGVKKGLGEVKDSLDRLDPSAISDVGGGLDEAAGSASKASKGLKETGDGAKGLKGGLDEAGKGLESLGRGLDKVKSFGDSYTKAVTVPMVGAGAAAVAAATDIDSALTDVRKTVDGTEAQYEALKDAAVEYSRTNAVSAADMLRVEALGAQLGFNVDELQEFGEVATGLDIATNMNAEQAATEMAHFANIMGMSHEDIGRYASTVVELGNSMATTESDVSAMAQRIAGAGKQVGMSEADVLGMAAALSSVGIEAEAGGTAISTIMSTIDKDVATGGERLQAWASQAGMSAEDFAAAWGESVPSALGALLTGMSQGVEEGGNMALMLDELGISSIRQTDTLKRLAGAGDLMTGAIDTANGAWEQNTALQAEVDNRNESLAARFEMLKNRVTEVAAEVGAPLADALLSAVDAAEPLFDVLAKGAEAFADMDEGQQRMVMGAAGAVAGLGPLLSVVGRLGTPVKALGGAFEALGKLGAGMDGAAGSAAKLIGSGAKAGLIGVAAAAATVAGALAVGAWMDYRKSVEDAQLATEGFLTAETEGFADAQTAAGDSVNSTRDRINELRETMTETADMVRGWQDQWAELGTKRSELDYYIGVMEELGGRADLTKGQQQELNDAVKKYNEITGDTVTIDENFNLSKTREELKKTADEWYNVAAAQQYVHQAEELIEKKAELEQQVAQKSADVQRQKDYIESLESEQGTTAAGYSPDQAKKIQDAKSDLQDLEAEYEKADAELQGMNSSLDEMYARSQVLSQTMLSSVLGNGELAGKLINAEVEASEFSDWLTIIGANADSMGSVTGENADKLVDSFKSVKTIADGLGVDVNELAQGMEDWGITTADITAVGVENFARFYREAGGDMEQVKQKIDEYKAADISNEAELETEGAEADIGKLNAADLKDKKATAYMDGGPLRKTVSEIDGSPVKDQQATITAVDNATGTISAIKSGIDSISSKSVTISVTRKTTEIAEKVKAKAKSGQARGGFVPGHAAGGIFTSPVLTNVGWVGEAGAEAVVGSNAGTAIVPIENRRYMAPFADAVADAMGQRGASTVVHNHYNVGGITYDTDSAVARCVGGLVRAAGIDARRRG